MVESGVLYVVSTPIGNLRDITLRALDVLGQVDLIAAEDTRRTAVLLAEYGIHTPMTSYHEYNRARKAPQLIARLQSGQSLALVSDAGTPGISDPGAHLVREALANGLRVEAIPGPTALVTALVISGLATDRFAFEGFLPAKKGRTTRLESLREETRTLVLYESPHRLLRTLRDLLRVLGDRQAVMARELTKKFQEVIRGSLSELVSTLERKKVKGEVVLIVAGKPRGERLVKASE
ncbi:MAG: 16S rRNA (cytidine(1402)-2'-O)-methyltransferase [candidate division KSB1 bacterium]|nr:16S rRNA (cytidine(1402)-2'-O)-methyltransferase [candidate division KSB1 bacterium]MDZ7385389.1 16S rRNA (cytidine(1402)-2'-O)-methyltransferase [candidate division KSB1 bacterium]MDZ7392199.1 16S rRNA (cytidine(1402)-2'-O)-methyltransferase [candidate division KSB1 bacterium]MDZ7412634.1 16S rRNA (cytidine(1402)-2'-O)-methyltransferase [candidate division KSB1 bacterium]